MNPELAFAATRITNFGDCLSEGLLALGVVGTVRRHINDPEPLFLHKFYGPIHGWKGTSGSDSCLMWLVGRIDSQRMLGTKEFLLYAGRWLGSATRPNW